MRHIPISQGRIAGEPHCVLHRNSSDRLLCSPNTVKSQAGRSSSVTAGHRVTFTNRFLPNAASLATAASRLRGRCGNILTGGTVCIQHNELICHLRLFAVFLILEWHLRSQTRSRIPTVLLRLVLAQTATGHPALDVTQRLCDPVLLTCRWLRHSKMSSQSNQYHRAPSLPGL